MPHIVIFFCFGIILAGMPTATASSGTSRKTTEFAPILAFLPIIIFPKSFAPVPTVTFSF